VRVSRGAEGAGTPAQPAARSRSAVRLPLPVSAGLGREDRLPRGLRCSDLAALRTAARLPSDSAVVLWSGVRRAAEVVTQLAGSRRFSSLAFTSASVATAPITKCTYDHIRAEKTPNNSWL